MAGVLVPLAVAGMLVPLAVDTMVVAADLFSFDKI